MLARTIAVVCGCVLSWGAVVAEAKKPNVIIIVQDGGGKSYLETISAAMDEKLWLSHRSVYRKSPGRSASLAAFMFGKSGIECGVINDFDWRRVPVAGEDLASVFKKEGYQTVFYGAGGGSYTNFDHRSFFQYGEGETLADPWSPMHGVFGKGFRPHLFLTSILSQRDLQNDERPYFCVLGAGRSLNMRDCIHLLRPGGNQMNHDTAVFILNRTAVKKSIESTSYHSPTEARFYYNGDKAVFERTSSKLKQCKTDWEIHGVIRSLLGHKDVIKPEYRFFHKADWPANESPEKHRHRGSLVVGNGYALVDGLELYPSTKTLDPDLTKPLDIAKHQKIHGKMLMAYGKWWQMARKALHHPRSFSVGKKDKEAIHLTAMDWRPSKIIHADGSVPSYKPVLYQKDVLAMLEGLRDEKYLQAFPAYSGSWSINVKRAGRYKITARLLPEKASSPEEKSLAKLQGGQAFFRLGRNKVQLNLLKGASAVSVLVDADAGVTDLECWFTGQLSLERELGAFFVEIERVGDKKFDLKAKEQGS